MSRIKLSQEQKIINKSITNKKYHSNLTEDKRKLLRERKRLWEHSNPARKLARRWRKRMYKVLSREQRTGLLVDILGCSVEFFKEYLAFKFQPGMSWDNHGFGEDKWNIDHIIPISKFDLNDIEQVKICFHYTNAQPMWQKDNLRKYNKLNF